MRYCKSGVFQDGAGNIVASGAITVTLAGTTTAATIYAASSGGSALTDGQTTSNSNGRFTFYVDAADYPSHQLFDITLSKSGAVSYVTQTYPNQLVLPVMESQYDLREFLPYGFVADGSVDYYSEIANSFSTIRAAGGGTLLLPIGVWAHGTGLALRGVDGNEGGGSAPLHKKVVNIVGVSKRDSILRFTGTGEGLYLNTSDSSYHGITTLKGFHLEGTGSEPGSVGLRLGTIGGESCKLVVDDICISKHGLGLELHHHYGSKFYNMQLRWNTTACQIGASTETNSFNQNSFHGCEFSWNSGKGLYILSGDHVVFDNCLIENNGDEGIYAERGATNIPSFYTFRDCWVENNQRDKTAQNIGQVYLHSTVGTGTDALNRFTFERCILEGPGNNYHFEIGNTLNLTLKDCRYSGGNDYIVKRKAATESGWTRVSSHNAEQVNLIKAHTGNPFPGTLSGYPDEWNGRTYLADRPSAGTWAVNDIVYNSAAATSGLFGWVCTVAGTPGVWADLTTGTTMAEAQVIESIKSIVTATTGIKGLWFFDPSGATTVVTDRSEAGHNAALSANASTLSPAVAGVGKNLNLTSSAYAEAADHGDFTFGNGATDSAFSVITLMKPNSVAVGNLLSKLDLTTGVTQKEWRFYFSTANLYFDCHDDSASATIGRGDTADLSGDTAAWHTYIATYDGSAAAAGIKVYRDGTQVDDADNSGGAYTAMEDKSAKVGTYHTSTAGARTVHLDAKVAVIAVIAEALTATQIKRLDVVLRGYTGVAF